MDTRELADLQVLGVCGIYKEGYKLIFSYKKIFTQITIALILPLTLVLLAGVPLSDLFGRILKNELDLDDTSSGSPERNSRRHRLSSEWALFWIFKVAYLFFLLIFSLLSTSAVVYSIACMYTAKPMTFKKVMSVVPKVWKRLLVTFLWNFLIMVGYHIALILVLVLVLWLISLGNSIPPLVPLIIVFIFYLIGFVYINVIWQLASVVSVLEEIYGIKAMKKCKILIKGKMFAAVFIFVLMSFSLVGVEALFEGLVVHGDILGVVFRVMIGIACFLLALVVILYGLVVQTVIYFVCKSYHHEMIDKSNLADHLEGYIGEYVRLRGSRDVQLEQIHVRVEYV